MKLLSSIFVFGLVIMLFSCNSESKDNAKTKEMESFETMDAIDEADEFEYLESAMDALNEEDYKLATEKVLKAAVLIKGYIGEMDDPVYAENAVKALNGIADKLKNGKKMTADQLQESLLKLEYFSDDDLEIDEESVEEEE